ncbi:MAG: hypothetical protein J0H24_08755, partial [Delftia acidovorans]|nr:hypothetical protein [Delftia acidovorans]
RFFGTGKSHGDVGLATAERDALSLCRERKPDVRIFRAEVGQPFSQGQRVGRPGSHVLQITARDRAGNQAQRTVVFTVLGTAVQEPVAVPAWPSDRAMLVLMCLAMAFVAHRALGKTRKK